MNKVLTINDIKEDTKILLNVHIHLNKVILTLIKKDKNYQKHVEYQKEFDFTFETNIEELIYKFYEEYVELKSVELFWTDKLNNMEIVDIDLDD
jgi:hypothetical protein